MLRCKRKKREEQDVQVGNDSSPETLQRAGAFFQAQVKHAMADAVKEKKNGSGSNKNKVKVKKRPRRCVQPESTTVALCF